jgi:hypothetical protein
VVCGSVCPVKKGGDLTASSLSSVKYQVSKGERSEPSLRTARQGKEASTTHEVPDVHDLIDTYPRRHVFLGEPEGLIDPDERKPIVHGRRRPRPGPSLIQAGPDER